MSGAASSKPTDVGPQRPPTAYDQCFKSFDGAFDKDGKWPTGLPPRTALATELMKHAGDGVIQCSLCNLVIPVTSFVAHESVAWAHTSAVGPCTAATQRDRKRKAVHDV
jgi:hypothetical protein